MTMAIVAAVVIIAYLTFVAVLVWLLVVRKTSHPIRLLAAIATLVAVLPTILYAFASVVTVR
jgi:hypothetical protein